MTFEENLSKPHTKAHEKKSNLLIALKRSIEFYQSFFDIHMSIDLELIESKHAKNETYLKFHRLFLLVEDFTFFFFVEYF